MKEASQRTSLSNNLFQTWKLLTTMWPHVSVHEGGGTRREIEVIVLFSGSCEGCSPYLDLFSRVPDKTASSDSNTRQLIAAPCFCPAPTRLAFLEEFNLLQAATLQRQASSVGKMLDVMELKKSDSCNVAANTTQAGEEQVQPQVHTALVSIVLQRDPDEMSNAELDEVLNAFRDVVHSNQALTSGTCDLSRKQILTVEADPNDRTIGRRLRGTPGELVQGDAATSPRRGLQQTSADFEFMLVVTFQCFGCEGRLFGVTNFTTPTLDCLCPINPIQQGVEPRALASPLNEALAASTIIDQSVSDVIEVEALECPSSFDIFSAIVVIEYALPTNLTEPTQTDIQALEDEFVAGYNGLARRYCDPNYRRLSSAETILYTISEDGLTASFEMSVIGTCRNCDDGIKVYDSESFFENTNITYGKNIVNDDDRRRLSPQESRKLQLDTTCYCNVAASRELGPSEPEVVQNFGALVDELSLESILNVSECKFLTFFQTAVILNFKSDVSNATQEELNLIGQTFVTSYNQANQEEGVCDSLFRELTDFRIDRDVAINDGTFSQTSALADPGGRSRRLQTRTSYHAPTRRTQEGGGVAGATSAPTFDPSAASLNNITSDPTFSPTTLGPAPGVGSSNTLILLQVSGTCRGCSSEFGLFNQVSGRRRLEDNGEEVNPADDTAFTNIVKQRVDSCFCPPQSTRIEPSKEQLRLALSSLPFVDGGVEFEEVALVECSVEIVEFDTTIVIDFSADGEIGEEDEASIAAGFIETYTRLSEDYCDDLFRRPDTVVSVRSEPISPPDENGFYRARFWIELKGSCRGCQDDEDLFDRQRRRRMQETELCFCEPGAEDRAPRTDEFQEEYATFFEGRRLSMSRELQYDGNLRLILIGVWQLGIEPLASLFGVLTDAGLIRIPNGITDIEACIAKLPSPREIVYIGDGFCDGEQNDNEEYIYNIEECGYDGGDCCESTCESTTETECGEFGYACVDPNEQNNDPANNADAGGVTIDISFCESQSIRLGDGICNDELNVQICGYDAGDCCPSTCTTGDAGAQCIPTTDPINCRDPNAVENSVCQLVGCTPPEYVPPAWCGDGYCDWELNNEACGYDGGDCCKESCDLNADVEYRCGRFAPYDCIDPQFLDLSQITSACLALLAQEGLSPARVGNGVCNGGGYNTPECDYDGGDCCPFTCVGECPYFDCRDEGILPTGCGSTSSDLILGYLGDGYCDYQAPYNTEACGWDLGDCCPDTCVSTSLFSCGVVNPYACADPSNDFFTINVDCISQLYDAGQDIYWVGDGYCDEFTDIGLTGPFFNTEVCGWDNGDCCPGTCLDSLYFDCGYAGYGCRDSSDGAFPAACAVSFDTGNAAVNAIFVRRWGSGGILDLQFQSEYESVTGKLDMCSDDGYPKFNTFSDGYPYNTPECNYNNGDCCLQTCTSFLCEVLQKDYNAEFNNCEDTRCSDVSGIGDGICQNGNNKPECLYDGGDCCEESCTKGTCAGISSTSCVDPEFVPLVDPPADVFVIGNWQLGYDIFAGIYSVSRDILFDQNVYYSDNDMMIYYCPASGSWVIESATGTKLGVIEKQGCEGRQFQSNPVENGVPGKLCDAVWEKDGTPLFILISTDCPTPDVSDVSGGAVSSFEITIPEDANPGYRICAGTYSEITDRADGGGLIMSNGACVFYQYFLNGESYWEVAYLFGLQDIIDTAFAPTSLLDYALGPSLFPCSAEAFYVIQYIFCSVDCPDTSQCGNAEASLVDIGSFAAGFVLDEGTSPPSTSSAPSTSASPTVVASSQPSSRPSDSSSPTTSAEPTLVYPEALSASVSLGDLAESTGPPSISVAPSQSTPPAIPLSSSSSSSSSQPSSEPSPSSSESSAPSKDPTSKPSSQPSPMPSKTAGRY